MGAASDNKGSGSQADSLVTQRFGQYAQNYVTSAPHAQGPDLDRMLAFGQPHADWIMLDVATGGGHTALRFAPYVAHVIASDITPAMLNAAETHLAEKSVDNVTFKQTAAEAMPFDDASFDLVTCRIAPHHFDDAARFVQEAARVLKPGGILLVQDHLLPDDEKAARYIEAFEKLRDPSHNQAFTKKEWCGMFAAASLTVTHVERFYKELNVDSWAARQGVTDSTKACLNALMAQASPVVRAWLQPQAWGTPDATYRCHQVIVRGVKAE